MFRLNALVPQQNADQPHERHRRRNFRARAFEKLGEEIELGHVEFRRTGIDLARGQKAAERLAPFEQILRLRAVRRRTVKRRFGNDVVADGNVEPRAEFAQLLLVHLFLLMRNVAAFAGFAEAVAFHRLGQNHRRPALVLHRGLVGGIDFARVMAAAQQLANLVVGEVVHQFEQFGIFAEEMPARVAARLDGILLVIAIHRLFHALERAGRICRARANRPNRCPR